ncbi:hypothetical protein BT69DRAFT_1301965 [Atractiella rhizophila]|nr:hypothetical protein BT69DRAFT_1301965 [Atractiella rhizophila]
MASTYKQHKTFMEQLQPPLSLCYVAIGKPDLYTSPNVITLDRTSLYIRNVQDQIRGDLEANQPSFKKLEVEVGTCRVRIWQVNTPLLLTRTNLRNVKETLQSIDFPWNDPHSDEDANSPEHSLSLEILLPYQVVSDLWKSQPDRSQLHIIAEVLPFENLDTWQRNNEELSGIQKLAQFQAMKQGSFLTHEALLNMNHIINGANLPSPPAPLDDAAQKLRQIFDLPSPELEEELLGPHVQFAKSLRSDFGSSLPSSQRSLTLRELLHYSAAVGHCLYMDLASYRDNKEAYFVATYMQHVANELADRMGRSARRNLDFKANKQWKFHLLPFVLNPSGQGQPTQFRYHPRNHYEFRVHEIPRLIVEVQSVKEYENETEDGEDQTRMLLEGAAVVTRYLMCSENVKKPSVRTFCSSEVCLRVVQGGVVYLREDFSLTEKKEAFMFLLGLYNSYVCVEVYVGILCSELLLFDFLNSFSQTSLYIRNVQDQIRGDLEANQPSFKKLEIEVGTCRVRIWQVNTPLFLTRTNLRNVKETLQSIDFPWNDPNSDEDADSPKRSLALEILLPYQVVSDLWTSQPDRSQLHIIAEVLPFENLDTRQPHNEELSGIQKLAQFQAMKQGTFLTHEALLNVNHIINAANLPSSAAPLDDAAQKLRRIFDLPSPGLEEELLGPHVQFAKKLRSDFGSSLPSSQRRLTLRELLHYSAAVGHCLYMDLGSYRDNKEAYFVATYMQHVANELANRMGRSARRNLDFKAYGCLRCVAWVDAWSAAINSGNSTYFLSYSIRADRDRLLSLDIDPATITSFA